MSAFLEDSNSGSAIQILLFVDERSQRTKEYQEIKNYLDDRHSHCDFEIKIVDVSKHPDLAEYFKIVAIPTLIKIAPQPKQVFAGAQLIDELNNWWPQWNSNLRSECSENGKKIDPLFDSKNNSAMNIAHLSEVIRLSDEVFKLQQQQEELFEQLRFKDQVIGMMVHDLRNPLTAAVLALDTLGISNKPEDRRNNHLQPELIQKLLQSAKAQLKNIDRLISDVLQLSLGAVSDIQLHPQRLDLEVLITSAIQQLNSQLQSKGQIIITDIPQDLPPIYADRQRIDQVLINLLDNAIKYTPTGGKIQVVALHRTTQKVQVNIIDNGAGIPTADCELIFQRNYRLLRDSQEDGYGLGLPLCRSIISAHYGQIWVESSEQGSSFNFTLPVYSIN